MLDSILGARHDEQKEDRKTQNGSFGLLLAVLWQTATINFDQI
jgi:hypothetical protein